MTKPSHETADQLVRFGFDDDTWLEHLRRTESRGPLGRAGHFDLLEEVSRGGQSIVFRAIDRRSNEVVAVKRLLGGADASSASRIRFEREAEISSRLEHSAIAPIRESFHEKSSSYLVMRWIDGVPITEWAASGERPAGRGEILDRIARVADALRHAHQRGVLHRDLKPANILIDAEGEPHLLDFGLGKIHEEQDGGLTKTGLFAGTPAYASPEQIRGGVLRLDVRSDLYSLGVIAYEMLTGRLPYDLSSNLLDNLRRILDDDTIPARQVDASIDRDLEAILAKALARDPDDRYQSAESFLQDLRRYRTGEAVEAKSPNAWERMVHSVRRNPLPAVFASVVFLLLTGFGATMTVLYQRAERETERAREIQAFLESTLAPEGAGSRAQEIRLTDILATLSTRIENEIDDPEIEADLRTRLTEMYVRLWHWAEAGPEALRALALHEKLGSPPEVRGMLLTMAGHGLTFREDPEGIEYMRRAVTVLEGAESVGGTQSLAFAHGGLAFALWRNGRADEAEAEYEKAFALYAETGADEETPTVGLAGLYYHYGAMLNAAGREEEAEASFRTALDMYDRLPAELDIHRLTCMDDYGRMLVRAGRYGEAEPLIEQALALRHGSETDARRGFTLWSSGVIAAKHAGDWARAREHMNEGAVAMLEYFERNGEDGSADLRARIGRNGLTIDDFDACVRRLTEIDPGLGAMFPRMRDDLNLVLANAPASSSSRASNAPRETVPSHDRTDGLP